MKDKSLKELWQDVHEAGRRVIELWEQIDDYEWRKSPDGQMKLVHKDSPK